MIYSLEVLDYKKIKYLEDFLLDNEIKFRKVEQKHICQNCGDTLVEIKDSIAKKFTGHLFTCVCMPGIQISIG